MAIPVSSRAQAVRGLRTALFQLMGGRCSKCGESRALEFHFTGGSGRAHHRLDSARRQTFYFKAWEAGELQLLCASCHRALSAEHAATRREAVRQFRLLVGLTEPPAPSPSGK